MRNYIEIWFWKIAIRLIKKDYGANCETSDLNDFQKTFKNCEDVFSPSRCPSCQAREIINWIEGYIELLKKYD